MSLLLFLFLNVLNIQWNMDRNHSLLELPILQYKSTISLFVVIISNLSWLTVALLLLLHLGLLIAVRIAKFWLFFNLLLLLILLLEDLILSLMRLLWLLRLLRVLIGLYFFLGLLLYCLLCLANLLMRDLLVRLNLSLILQGLHNIYWSLLTNLLLSNLLLKWILLSL